MNEDAFDHFSFLENFDDIPVIDNEIDESLKNGDFNEVRKHLLTELKAVIPTEQKPQDSSVTPMEIEQKPEKENPPVKANDHEEDTDQQNNETSDMSDSENPKNGGSQTKKEDDPPSQPVAKPVIKQTPKEDTKEKPKEKKEEPKEKPKEGKKPKKEEAKEKPKKKPEPPKKAKGVYQKLSISAVLDDEPELSDDGFEHHEDDDEGDGEGEEGEDIGESDGDGISEEDDTSLSSHRALTMKFKEKEDKLKEEMLKQISAQSKREAEKEEKKKIAKKNGNVIKEDEKIKIDWVNNKKKEIMYLLLFLKEINNLSNEEATPLLGEAIRGSENSTPGLREVALLMKAVIKKISALFKGSGELFPMEALTLRHCTELILSSAFKIISGGDLQIIKTIMEDTNEENYNKLEAMLNMRQRDISSFYKDVEILIDDFLTAAKNSLPPNMYYYWLIVINDAKKCDGYMINDAVITEDGKYRCYYTGKLLEKNQKCYILTIRHENSPETNYYISRTPPEVSSDVSYYVSQLSVFAGIVSFKNQVYVEALLHMKTVSHSEKPHNVLVSFFRDGRVVINLIYKYMLQRAEILKLKKGLEAKALEAKGDAVAHTEPKKKK
jgi:hypothetical protein